LPQKRVSPEVLLDSPPLAQAPFTQDSDTHCWLCVQAAPAARRGVHTIVVASHVDVFRQGSNDWVFEHCAPSAMRWVHVLDAANGQ
jgi:hypothetical protein